MTRKEAIDYLRPVADNAALANYQMALRVAIEAMEQLEQQEKHSGLPLTASRLR